MTIRHDNFKWQHSILIYHYTLSQTQITGAIFSINEDLGKDK